MGKERIQIKTRVSNGATLIADISDGLAIFTSSDKVLLRKLYEAERKKVSLEICKWVEKPMPAITRLYIDKSKEEINLMLLAELRNMGARFEQ